MAAGCVMPPRQFPWARLSNFRDNCFLNDVKNFWTPCILNTELNLQKSASSNCLDSNIINDTYLVLTD